MRPAYVVARSRLSNCRRAGTELDYTEQTSWLLFLKYLDGLEDDRAAVAALEGRSYTPILEEPYRWSRWAAPKNASGQLDHHASLHRRRPARLRERAPVPLPGALQVERQRAEHDRVQNRRDLR
jgi:hypothetical protein